MGVIIRVVTTAGRWLFPSLIGYVTSDILNRHEQSQSDDTIKSVAASAAGAARDNWVKWVMYMVVGVAVAIASIVIFKIKKK